MGQLYNVSDMQSKAALTDDPVLLDYSILLVIRKIR